MFSVLNLRAIVRLIAFALLAVFIWFAGPYFAFGAYHPLESETARYIAIALIVVAWLLSQVVKLALSRVRRRSSRRQKRRSFASVSRKRSAR